MRLCLNRNKRYSNKRGKWWGLVGAIVIAAFNGLIYYADNKVRFAAYMAYL